MSPEEARVYLERVSEDEPVFVLRARDIYSPGTISLWATVVHAGLDGNAKEPQKKKAREAFKDVERFRKWQYENPDKVKVPD